MDPDSFKGVFLTNRFEDDQIKMPFAQRLSEPESDSAYDDLGDEAEAHTKDLDNSDEENS